MRVNVGYIPYLNMKPFHDHFGPEAVQAGDIHISFQSVSPRVLGVEAENGHVDAGAMSFMDYLRLADSFELLGNFGIGVKRAANSVLVFSRKPLSELTGMCAVTDETSTSVRLLQVLLEKRYGNHAVSYGRIASSLLFDGEADSLLLIGDEALRGRKEGIKGLPIVTDLGEEWFSWQGTPFAFAHWVVRKSTPTYAKQILNEKLHQSLNTFPIHEDAYLSGFEYRLKDVHYQSMKKFKEFAESLCLIKS